MENKNEQKKPKLKIRFKRKPPVKPKKTTKESPGVDPELTGMLAKLATWTPKSNQAVMEAASRLMQAAREKIDYQDADMRKSTAEDNMKLCMSLVGHTLTRHNGVSNEFDYVLSVKLAEDRQQIDVESVHLFRRNRIGEPAISHRFLHFQVDSILTDDPEVLARVKRNKPACILPGYAVDTREAAEAYRRYAPVLADYASGVRLPRNTKRGRT